MFMRFFMLFINTIYWIWLFVIPMIPMGIVSIWIYDRSSKNLPYIILLGIMGLILGVLLAESVRKKHGLSTFFSWILGSTDMNEGEKRTNKNTGDEEL
jgi:hypothetical protein